MGPGYSVSSVRQRGALAGFALAGKRGSRLPPHTPAPGDQQQLRSTLLLRDEGSVLGFSLTMPLRLELADQLEPLLACSRPPLRRSIGGGRMGGADVVVSDGLEAAGRTAIGYSIEYSPPELPRSRQLGPRPEDAKTSS
jgi:hypothetical protein